MKPLTTFNTKKNRQIEIIEPSMEWLDEILVFVNKLAKEDTFLSFHPGKEISRADEEIWLKNVIERAKNGSGYLFWAVYNGKIVGSVDVHRGSSVRSWHVGTIGLMVDEEFRGEGLGKFLLEFVVNKACEVGMRTVILELFSDNGIAYSLYKKVGFVEYGRLLDGLYRQNKFSDQVWMYLRIN